MQQITIPPGHDMHIVIDATQAPLGQRWRIGAWGQRDGVQNPIPDGWTPPHGDPQFPWQLIRQEQTFYADPPPTHKVIDWGKHNHQLTLVYEGWAHRNGEQVSLDQIKQSDDNHFLVVFDRVQDDDAQDHSGHYKDMSIDTQFNPPLS